MNVTKHEVKYSQPSGNGQVSLFSTDSLQKDSAERERYAGGYNSHRITENNITNARGSVGHCPSSRLLEEILDDNNINNAIKRVKSNKGAHGIDGMETDELQQYFVENGDKIKQSILEGKYKPNPVRRVEIPKDDGKSKRPLGIPTVVDRVIQQAIAQVLSPIYEQQFSDNSFGFRPNRNQHGAIERCLEHINNGYIYVVDMDLEKFFDTVNQSKLIEVLSRTINDGRVISLIHKYLGAGVIIQHTFKETEEGVPQGGPLSPLLSNIILNELDKKLTERGHRFVRYADDLMIFCRSRRAAERVLNNIVPFIENKLFLRVNQEKTSVDYVARVKFLGFGFYQKDGKFRVRIHPKSIAKMKTKIKLLTSRSNGWSNETRIIKLQQYIRGWINYFKIADIASLLQKTDEWMRRRIRMIYWKQWKKVKTRTKMLKKLGISEEKSIGFANTRKGYWRIARSPALHKSLGNETLKKMGYLFFLDYFKKQTA